MIIRFSVTNFGPIREKQTISFEAKKDNDLENYYVIEPIKGLRLLKLIFLYGANASGKTTMLNAIEFLRNIVVDPLDKKNEKFDFNPFLFDTNSKNSDSIIEIYFVQKSKKYSYTVEFNKNVISKETLLVFNPNKATVFKRTTNLSTNLTEIVFGSKVKLNKDYVATLVSNTLSNNTVFGGFLKTNIDIMELREVLDWFESALRPMISPRTDLDGFVTRNLNDGGIISKENVLEVLKKADLNIEDISIEEKERDIPEGWLEFLETSTKNEENRKKIYSIREKGKVTAFNLEFVHKFGNTIYKLPFENQSQGTQRFYGLAGILDILVRQKSIVPIDELESSLHPDLYIHFILMHLVNSSKSQLIATTHNRELLKNRDIFRDDSIWFANKTEEGNSEIYSLADFDTKTIRNSSNVFNAYSIGKLGGVPELGDYFLDFKYDENEENK